MSCFVVDPETMDRIVYFIVKNTQSFCGIQTGDFWGYQDEDTPNKVGRLLYKLNEDAWNYRYAHLVRSGEEEPAHEHQESYTWNPHGTDTNIQTYKSIRCFLYQCSEGEQFENHEAYKHLVKLSDALAHHIVSDLPEYNRAPWG